MDKEKLLKGKIPCKETGIEVKKSICSICNPNSHCGFDLYVKDGEIIKVEGMKEHPVSRGTLCSKGAATRQYVYSPDRLQTPMKRVGPKGTDDFVPISWEEAYSLIAEKLNGYKIDFGPEAVSFFVGYSKWMRPYVQRLAQAFGSPNYCTESSTCFKATYIAWKLLCGSFCTPHMASTDCLMVWSNNPLYTNTPMASTIFKLKDSGTKIIVIDPRLSPIAEIADIHLRIKPGTDGALALGMANVIISEELHDKEFIKEWTAGFEDYAEYVKEYTPEAVEQITGIPAELMAEAARAYAGSKTGAILPSSASVVHHTNGVQNYRAVFMLSGLTGKFDKAGGNIMNTYSYLESTSGFPTNQEAYMHFKDPADMAPRVGADKVPVWCEMTNEAQAMFLPDQIISEDPYPIRAVLGFGMNRKMWNDTKHMKEALRKLDFFVNIDIFKTETCNYADIILPVCTSVERGEFKSYGNGYCIHTKPAIEPLFESKTDLDIVFELAKRLDIDDELMPKGYEENLNWILEPSGITMKSALEHESGFMAPFLKAPEFEKYKKSRFKTPSGKMEFASGILKKYDQIEGIDALPKFLYPVSSPQRDPKIARDYPFIINTGGRLPMYLHSRTFRLPWTAAMRPVAAADINPEDAKRLGIEQHDDIRIFTPHGEIFIKANVTEIALEGVVFVYHGYPDIQVNGLLPYTYRDPISGFPGFNSFLGNVEKVKKGEK
ncbi:molybdopterin-containing oxidoreductase family protein [Parasporobacterium paucivorans]|uniref:Anaerobic selenocysteine-containing dehydrogenase n=1 Tax=Parasporobacterium paucivorans DSM 15970 TaxID=1122934 RepID=A0A1M6IGT7_9FIRM|nr:molybdopterin-dependent oxidoreductase [Parasporobacterium paucivorans]SHJ33647.1 Anaerobic selenocysteine-containing dehydrogenase [Parasporobacterium paucivorans DSM 15970]